MAKTTIDVVQLSFSLAKNTETITQKVLNDLGAIAEKADGIALNINDENIQKQLSGIKAMLEGELSNINIGHLGSDFLKMFLDINRSAEENAQGLDDFYNKLVQISRLPEELKTKLSGIKGIQWNDLFKDTTVNTQNIDEDVKKYLVSEEKAIEKLGKLYQKYEELDNELYTDRKKTKVDPSVQKEMNQNLAEQAKYYARLKALKKMTEDEWMDWTTNQDFSFDTGVIEDGLDSISTKTKETIAKIEALGDLNFNKKIEKIFDATKFQNNIQNAIENGTLVGSGGSTGGFSGDYTLNAKLDITEEEIQALVSKVKAIFEQSPINPKLVFEDSELQTLLSKVKELFESNAIDAKINISEDEIRKIKELISISNQQKADSETDTANQVINISDGEIYSVLDKIQSVFDEKQINVKIDVSDEAIANVREKISEFSEYGLAARIGLWADIDGFIQRVSDGIEDAQFTAHVQLKDENGNPIVNGVNVNTGTVTTTSKNSDEQPVIVSPVTFLKMFKEWNEAERINVRANKSLAYLNERGMFFNPETGDHTNPYVYDKHSRFSANNELIEEFKKLNNNAQSFNSYIHTHPESKTAFSDMDFQAMKTYKNRGIDHQYVMGLENVTHFNTKDFDASDFDKLTKHMEGVVEAFYKTQKDKNGKLFAERKYSGETFKNYLEWGGKYDQFMTDTVETLQKSLLNSKNNIDLTNPDVALNFKNLTSSKGMMEDVVKSIFTSKILVGENNYLSPSKYEQAISKELWGALGIDPNLKNLPDIAKPLKTAIGWVNNLNTFGSMGSDRGKYTSRDIRDALDDYSYKTTYDLIDSMVDQNGKKKYDASKIMQQWTKDYFFANDPQHLGGTVLKQMQDSGVADGASQLESIISPLTGKLGEVSTAIEANTNAVNALSDSLKSQKDTKKTEPQKQTATKTDGTKATRSKASTVAENGKTQPTPLQDAVNKLTAEVKHASELLSGITNGVQQDGNVQSVEQTKPSTKKKTATKKEESITSPEEKPQEQPNVKITGEMAKGLEALSPLKGSIDALKTSVDGATSAIKSIGTNKIQPDKNKIIGKQEKVKAYTSSDEESDGKKYIEYYDPKYIEEYFKKDTRRNISRYNGTTFYNYLKSNDTFDSLTKEIINYAGQSVIDGMAKSGQPLDQKAMKKLLEIQNPKNQEKFLNGIFSSGILRGENNYLNPDKYNNAIINAVLKQIDTIIEKPVRDAILEQFRGRENPLSKYFTSFMQIEDQTPYYKPELRDKVLSFITETYGNVPKLRKEIKLEEPKTESPTIQQQKPNQTEDALGPHVTNLINAVEQNTAALNGLSDKLSSTRVYADPNGSRKAIQGTKSRKTENTTESDTEKPKVEKEISQEQQQQNENLKSQISYREQGLSLLQQQSETEQKERLYLEQQARDTQKFQDEQLAAIQTREQIEKRKAKEEKERREREEKERRENISNARGTFIDSSVYDTKAKKKEQERERQRQLAEQRAAESIAFSRSNVDQGIRNNQSEQIIRGYKELADLQRKLQVMYLDGAEESSIAKQIELINQKKNAIQELITKVGELRDSEKNAQNEYNNSADEFDLSSPNSYARKTLNERLNTYSNRATSLRDYQFVHGTPTTEFYDRIDNILNLINEVRSKDGLDLTNEKDIAYLNDVESKIHNIFADLEVDKKVDKDLYRRLYSAVNPNIVNTKVGQFYDYIKRNSKAKYAFKDRINELNEQADFLWRNNDSISPPMFEEFRDSFNNFMTDVKARGLEGISFMDKIGKKFQDVAAYFASFVSIYQVINVIRQAGAAVLDLNSKLIELSKVSNTSIADLEHQFQSFSEISKEIGGTVSDTIQATADWARNGYSLPDSKELARVAQIYKNVGDGIDINQANESLISTLRGYNLEAKDALSIVDKINSVANTQPIDSGGLGEALQRSAASFQAANTSLSESIALITASNAVVQHPERVGNMWKTVSARIRGASAELQEMNEDTDNMVESSSKLRELVMGITGFDIMKDENTFKSIYEIVLGIGEVWKDLSDVDQAALLEKLAGKTQSNALAAALNNVDILKEAYQTAEDSMGSAMEEQQRFAEGLQYHLNQFNQARESLSHNLVDSDLLKFFVDLGTIGVESIDKITQSIGGLSVIISSFMVIGGLKTKDGGPLLYFTEFGKQITSLIHTVASAKGLGGVTKAIEGIGEIGTTAIGMGGVVALSAAFTMAYKAYDNYVHKYSDSMNAMRKHTSGIEDQKKEIESLNEEYQSVQDKITEINNMGGAKVSREGELEQLQAQSKELERQIALKEASAKVELGKAYKEAQKATSAVVEAPDQVDINAINAEMTREEYLKNNFGIYGGSKTKTRVSVDKAIPRMIAQYDALIAKRKEYQDQVDKLSHDKSGVYNEGMVLDNADSINEAKEKIEEYNLSIEESREQLVQWYNDVQDRADVIETYAEYGHILDENDKATIALAKSTKEQLKAMDEAEASANGAANGQNSLHNSVVKTKEQMASQKTAVDNLISSYRELFELSTKGDGLDVVLDDDQLTKYGNALEYVNGVYKLNTDKLFELAEANNQAKISELDHEKQLANMKYLKNAKEIEIYNDMLKEGKSLTEDGGSIKGRIANLKAENQAIVEQNNVRNYQISQLENVTSAYQKWLAVSGQEVDAKAFTGVQDAAKSIDDLIKKGKIGLDSYKLAVDFVIPTDIDHEDTEAVQKYIKNNITPYFTEDRTGIDKFLKKSKYFEHDKEYGGYVLKEGTSVNDIAKDMGWTVEVTRAMIDQLETFGGKFKWDIEGMFSDTDKLVHYQEELAKINEEKETFNMEGLSDADEERLKELNNQADALIAKIDELQGKVNKTTFDKINKGVEESGGVDAVHKGYEQLVELGADQTTISDYVKKTTGVTTPQEVQLYTDEAQKNVEALTTQLDTLKEKYESGELALSYDDYQKKVQDLTDQIQEQGFMVQMLNEVLLEDAGVSTEETVSKIAGLLETISGYVGTIAAREPEEKPSGNEGNGNTGGGKKPAVNSNDFNGELPEGLEDTHIQYTIEADASQMQDEMSDTAESANGVTTAVNEIPSNYSIHINNNFSAVEAGAIRLGNTITNVIKKLQELKAQQPSGGTTTGGGGSGPTQNAGGVTAKGNAFARGNDIVGEQGRELVVDPHKGIWYTVGNSGTEMIDLPEDAIVYSHNQTEALLKSGVTTRGKSTGRSFADGTLVGERGRELIVDPNIGQWYTVGENGSEMINLPKDAIVYNHQQTEDLLKNGHTSRGHSTGASFASGNAYVRVEGTDGSGGGRKNGKQGITGGIPDAPKGYKASVNAAKAAEKAAKSAEEAAKNAKEDAEDAKESIDWIERALEYQNDQIKKWKDVVDDDYEPYSNRFNALEGYKNQLIEQEEILTEALHRRNEKFEEDSKKLTDAIGEEKAQVILERVLKGDVDPGEWLQKFQDEFGAESGEKIYKIVVDLQTDNKNIESTKNAIHENAIDIRDAEQEAFKMRLNIIKAAKDDLDYEMDVLQHNLDMKDVLGRMVVEADYQEMIDLTDDMADNLREQRDVLEEQLDSLEEGSQEWYNCKQEINSVNKELMECEKNQAEWNDKIMRLPIERIDRYINMLNNIKKDLENWSAEQNVLGIDTTAKTIEQRFDIAQRAIKKYNEQVDKYRDLLSHYEYGSDKFEETANSIQDCEDNVSSLIQEMRELNIQFLKLPIDDITKANEKLQNINAAEQRVLDDYDTALSTVLSKFDQLIDKRNDEIDILNKRYDEMIKPYQDQLDLLNEQNEAKQMQYNIDKAQYDLDKARQQKNVQVVRNGRIEYDSDIDALKSAQDNLNNAKHDKAVYDLQQQIDALEKERDSKIEPLEKEIDKLEDARNRWQTFEDERTFEKEAAEAVRLLGANWEKAIEGTITNPHSDDREYDIFSKNHIQLDRQITNNEKQIENNERMIDLMTRYVDAYMSGEMTYEEARSQYDKLYKDYQSGATLTSQESLAAELAFNRAKDMGDALRLNNAETKKSYDSFLGQLEKANEYNKTIDKYTKTWDEINESITKQLAELERLAALAEEIAAQRRSSGGGRSGGGDSDGGGGVWSKNPTGYGAHTKYNPTGHTIYGSPYSGTPDAVFTGLSLGGSGSGSGGGSTSNSNAAFDSLVEFYSRSHSSSGGGGGGGSSRDVSIKASGDVKVESKSTEVKSSSKPSGPASDPSYTSRGKGPHAFADGLAKGMVGGLNPSEKFKKLQAMGLKPLEPDEVPAFLHVGEGVVNAIQQSNILKSVGNAFKAGVASIPTDAVKSVENNYTFDCQFGDFILPNVEDTNGFANAMKNNFESIMNQQFSKIF